MALTLITNNGGAVVRTTASKNQTHGQVYEANKAFNANRAASRLSPVEARLRESMSNVFKGSNTEMFDLKLDNFNKGTFYSTAEEMAPVLYRLAKTERDLRGNLYMKTPDSNKTQLQSAYTQATSMVQTLGGADLGDVFYLKAGSLDGIVAFVEQPVDTQYTAMATVLDTETLGGEVLDIDGDMKPFSISLDASEMIKIGLINLIDNQCGCTGQVDGTATSRLQVRFLKGNAHGVDTGETEHQFNRGFNSYLEKSEPDLVQVGKTKLTFVPAIDRNTLTATGDYAAGMKFNLRPGDLMVVGTMDILNECNIETICARTLENNMRTICYKPTQATICFYTADCMTDELKYDHLQGDDELATASIRNSLYSVINGLQATVNHIVYDALPHTDAGTMYNMTPLGATISVQNNIRVPNSTTSIINTIIKDSPRQITVTLDERDFGLGEGKKRFKQSMELAMARTGMSQMDTTGMWIAGAVGKLKILGGFMSDPISVYSHGVVPNTLMASKELNDANMKSPVADMSLFSAILNPMGTGNISVSKAIDDGYIDSTYNQLDTVFGFKPKEFKRLVIDHKSVTDRADSMTKGLLGGSISINGGYGHYDVANMNKDASIANLEIFTNVYQDNSRGMRLDPRSKNKLMPAYATKNGEALKAYATFESGIAPTGEAIKNSFRLKIDKIVRVGGFVNNNVAQPTMAKTDLAYGNSPLARDIQHFEAMRGANRSF